MNTKDIPDNYATEAQTDEELHATIQKFIKDANLRDSLHSYGDWLPVIQLGVNEQQRRANEEQRRQNNRALEIARKGIESARESILVAIFVAMVSSILSYIEIFGFFP